MQKTFTFFPTSLHNLVYEYLDLGDPGDAGLFEPEQRNHWMTVFRVVQTETETRIILHEEKMYHSLDDQFARKLVHGGRRDVYEWYKFGKLHRERDKAAVIVTYPYYPVYSTKLDYFFFTNGLSVHSRSSSRFSVTDSWYKAITSIEESPVLHRTDAPAKRTFNEDSIISEWIENGRSLKSVQQEIENKYK